MLYALGVGAGTAELAFTTEHGDEPGHARAGHGRVGQEVLPTFATLGGPPRPSPEVVGDYDPAMLVHGEHSVDLAGPLPAKARVSTTAKIVGIFDKRSGALVVTESRSVDSETGKWLFTNRAGAFIRGEGGWEGEPRPPASAPSDPSDPSDHRDPPDHPDPPDQHRAPDFVVRYPTRTDQALIYRLSGDRNPIHSDPAYARRAGFDRPILHGLCTWGFTGRALLHSLCGSDPARFGSMAGRFAAPVYPGDWLTVSIWVQGEGASFFTCNQSGQVVLDRGRFRRA